MSTRRIDTWIRQVTGTCRDGSVVYTYLRCGAVPYDMIRGALERQADTEFRSRYPRATVTERVWQYVPIDIEDKEEN